MIKLTKRKRKRNTKRSKTNKILKKQSTNFFYRSDNETIKYLNESSLDSKDFSFSQDLFKSEENFTENTNNEHNNVTKSSEYNTINMQIKEDKNITWKLYETEPQKMKTLNSIYPSINQKLHLILKNIPSHISNKSKPIDFFFLIFEENIFSHIKVQSNLYANQIINDLKSKDLISRKSRLNFWKPFTMEDIYTYIGLILWTGLLSNKKLEDNWKRKDPLCYTNFYKYMTYNRFQLVHRFFHLNDNTQDTKNEPLNKVKLLLDQLNHNSKLFYNPGKYIVIDETMVKFKGKVHFRQRCPLKPVKYGVKCFLICDSTNGYCLTCEVYTGKHSTQKHKEYSTTESLVINLTEPFIDEYRILYLDNLYTTIKLGNYFLEKKTGVIGTLRKNRVHSKNNLLFPRKNKYNVYVNENKNICLIFGHEKKEFILLTTVSFPIPDYNYVKSNHKNKVNDIIKLDTINDYNKHSKGVDLCNQKTTHYRFPHASTKWWKPLCYHLFQIAIHNSYIISKHYILMDYKTYYKSIIKSLLEKGINYNSSISQLKLKRTNRSNHKLSYISEEKKSQIRKRCTCCMKKTMWKCQQCNIPYCIPTCFNNHLNIK